MTKKFIADLLAAGYVETAPACGDCKWATEEPQGLFCCCALCLVSEHARCQKWEAAEHWLKANPLVAQRYITSPGADAALSPSELAYVHKDYALPANKTKGIS